MCMFRPVARNAGCIGLSRLSPEPSTSQTILGGLPKGATVPGRAGAARRRRAADEGGLYAGDQVLLGSLWVWGIGSQVLSVGVWDFNFWVQMWCFGAMGFSVSGVG